MVKTALGKGSYTKIDTESSKNVSGILAFKLETGLLFNCKKLSSFYLSSIDQSYFYTNGSFTDFNFKEIAEILVTIKKIKSFLKAPEGDWALKLEEYMEKPEFFDLELFLKAQYENGVTIFPPRNRIFAAFENTQFCDVRVVILGQDPYHGLNQANGLCFSVARGVPVSPSLANIYRELRDDMGCLPPSHGCLKSWAKQGVLLINSVLTVEQSAPGSHRAKGWEIFTDAIITLLNDEQRDLVFLLWGNYARKKGVLIDRRRHKVLEAAHPSPLSAYRGFYGCKHFSLCNAYLKKFGKKPIDWQLPLSS